MGSGVLPLAMTTRPAKDQRTDVGDQGSGEKISVSSSGACRCVRRVSTTACAIARDDCLRNRAEIKPIERLVPVGPDVTVLTPPAYRRDGLSRLLGETWF
jgi:hypothetical protein